LLKLIQSMGTLRMMLHGLAYLLILILPFSEPSWNPEGASLILGAVIPAIAPIVAIIIMMDVMMCKISQSDSPIEEVKLKFKNIALLNMLTAALLTGFWIYTFSGQLLG
jgi:hypothetical protein